jgi:hypothetical protein
MKVNKIKLDESIFNDYDFNFEDEDDTLDMFQSDDFDDDFDGVDYERVAKMSEVPQGPKPGATTGVADTLIALINDEWEAVQGYNNFVEMIRAGGAADESVIKVIQDIAAEENKHVGQLQELLKKYSPNAAQIKVGEAEAKQQMSPRTSMIAGLQFWDTPKSQGNTQACAEDEVCTLVDADDEF